jgi:drug/metabolite transporter (DMT)-like permease
MDIAFLLLITASGFFHAFYNFLMRRSQGSRMFLTGIFTVGAILSWLVTLLSGTPFVIPQNAFVLNVLAASFFYALYQIFVSQAYERGDIALVYPLSMLSPLFIPLLALVFLSEVIPFGVWLGICVTIAGSLLVQLNAVSFAEIRKIVFFSRDYRAARWAFAASFMYAIGSVFDKSRIGEFNLLVYMNLILTFMSVMLLTYSALFERQAVGRFFSRHFKPVLIGGASLFLSFLLFRYALQHIYVSIAVPVRLSSIVFAVLLGVFVLREKITRKKLAGVAIVILGILFIQWFT